MQKKKLTGGIILGIIGLVLALILGVTALVSQSEAEAADTNFTVTTSISPTQLEAGNNISITVTVKNTSRTRRYAVTNLSLIDPSGTSVYTKTWPGQYFYVGKAVTLITGYTIAPNAAPGIYSAKVLLQNNDQTITYYSNSQAGTLSVMSAIKPTATAAPTNTVSTTATATATTAPTNTAAPTATIAPTNTAAPTATATKTVAPTPTNTVVPTSTPAPTATVAPTPTITPSSASIYWGAYINGVPWDMTKLDSFEQTVNKKVSIVHFGQPWWQSGAYNKFPTYATEQLRLRGSIPMINWGSWDSCCGPNQPIYSLANIYNGVHDTYIRQWATDAKAWGHPLFLRFDHEMNGWWQFPWSERLNGNQSGDYVKMWKHVHDIFTQVGATNVTWVWCPNIVSSQSTPLVGLYPGDSYVDWVAMDGYNWGTDQGNIWQSFSQVFSQTYNALSQLAPGKPIMIAEIASSENGGSKAGWIKDTYQTQLPRFPNIKAIVWFDWNAGSTSLSWPIESSQTSIDAFNAAIASDYYRAGSNQFVLLSATPIIPLTK
jgi:hypothetical protein